MNRSLQRAEELDLEFLVDLYGEGRDVETAYCADIEDWFGRDENKMITTSIQNGFGFVENENALVPGIRPEEEDSTFGN